MILDDEEGMDVHALLRDRMFIFRRIYGEVRGDFEKFESDWS
jgi:hypothetical protein